MKSNTRIGSLKSPSPRLCPLFSSIHSISAGIIIVQHSIISSPLHHVNCRTLPKYRQKLLRSSFLMVTRLRRLHAFIFLCSLLSGYIIAAISLAIVSRACLSGLLLSRSCALSLAFFPLMPFLPPPSYHILNTLANSYPHVIPTRRIVRRDALVLAFHSNLRSDQS